MTPNLDQYRFLDGPLTRKIKAKDRKHTRILKLMLIQEFELVFSVKFGQEYVFKQMDLLINLLKQI